MLLNFWCKCAVFRKNNAHTLCSDVREQCKYNYGERVRHCVGFYDLFGGTEMVNVFDSSYILRRNRVVSSGGNAVLYVWYALKPRTFYRPHLSDVATRHAE